MFKERDIHYKQSTAKKKKKLKLKIAEIKLYNNALPYGGKRNLETHALSKTEDEGLSSRRLTERVISSNLFSKGNFHSRQEYFTIKNNL